MSLYWLPQADVGHHAVTPHTWTLHVLYDVTDPARVVRRDVDPARVVRRDTLHVLYDVMWTLHVVVR